MDAVPAAGTIQALVQCLLFVSMMFVKFDQQNSNNTWSRLLHPPLCLAVWFVDDSVSSSTSR